MAGYTDSLEGNDHRSENVLARFELGRDFDWTTTTCATASSSGPANVDLDLVWDAEILGGQVEDQNQRGVEGGGVGGW